MHDACPLSKYNQNNTKQVVQFAKLKLHKYTINQLLVCFLFTYLIDKMCRSHRDTFELHKSCKYTNLYANEFLEYVRCDLTVCSETCANRKMCQNISSVLCLSIFLFLEHLEKSWCLFCNVLYFSYRLPTNTTLITFFCFVPF